MKHLNKLAPIALIIFMAATLTGCQQIWDAGTGIFKAGAVTGIIALIVVIAIIFWIIKSLFGGNRNV